MAELTPEIAAEHADFVISRGLLFVVASVALVVSILIQNTLWLVMLFQVLACIQAPKALWVLYWCYVPVCLIVQVLANTIKGHADKLAKALTDASQELRNAAK